MKKSKKIPKTHLPKFNNGGKNDATSNLYNEKRKSNLSNDQWAAVAQGVASTGAALSANQSLTGQDKTQADYNAINSGVNSVAGAVTPWYTYAKAGSDMGRGMIARDENGKPVDKTNAQIDAVMKPHHEMITEDLSKGNTGLAVAELLLPGIGIESRSNSLGLSNTINKTLGVKNTDYMYAMGGMNMQPNAEIEKQENVVAPNGGFLQANGPSHDQGGVSVALPGNSMIFSDRLKLGKKTFAELNKPNNTNKEDKLEAKGNLSKESLNSIAKNRLAKRINSDNIFAAQEALKQAKVEAYAKKMGVNLNQLQNPNQEFPMGGVKLPMYPYGGPITPEQYKQAQTDSMNLYKSGLNPKVPNWKYHGADNTFEKSLGNLVNLNGSYPKPTNNIPYWLTGQDDKTATFQKPTMIPYREASLEDPKKVPVVNHPNYEQFIPGINKSHQKVMTEEFKYGGKKLPKYEFGVLTPEEEGEDLESVWNKSSAKIDAQHGWNSNDETTRPGYKKQFDWQGLGSNVAMGLANNAGNIYNLSRYNKPEVEKYERLKATYLDPSAALRDAEAQTRRAEYNVRGASGGNAGTYLSNRVALNAQNTMNKARIHTDYQNANAGISNSVGQYNNELARQEVIANAMNRARTRSGKGEAIGSLGSNVANQMVDNKKGAMDQKTLGLLLQYYNTPEFQKLMKEYNS